MKEHMITEHNKQDSDDPGQLQGFIQIVIYSWYFYNYMKLTQIFSMHIVMGGGGGEGGALNFLFGCSFPIPILKILGFGLHVQVLQAYRWSLDSGNLIKNCLNRQMLT